MRAGSSDADRKKDPRPIILVLDPDPGVGEGLVLALRREASVEWVRSGMAGLMIAAEREVEVVITEEDLPDVSVDDLLRLLRLLRPGVSVALLGAMTCPRGTGIEEPDAHFPKPFDLRLLLAWILACISHAPTRRSSPKGQTRFEEGAEQHADIVHWTLDCIERCQRDGTSLVDFSRATGVSVWRLCRVFKRVTGLSLKRHLARSLLRGGGGILPGRGVPVRPLACAGGLVGSGQFGISMRSGSEGGLFRLPRQASPAASSKWPSSKDSDMTHQ